MPPPQADLNRIEHERTSPCRFKIGRSDRARLSASGSIKPDPLDPEAFDQALAVLEALDET